MKTRSGALGIWVAAAACVIAAGCSFHVPESKFYLLAPPAIGAASTQARGSVGVKPVALSRAYDDERIAYRDSDYSIGYFHYHRWAAPPGALLTDAVADLLKGSGRFALAELDSGAADYDVTVAGALREFYQDEREEPFQAVLTMDWKVGKERGAAVRITTKTQAALEDDTPEAFARAMSQALSDAVARLSRSIEESLHEQ